MTATNSVLCNDYMFLGPDHDGYCYDDVLVLHPCLFSMMNAPRTSFSTKFKINNDSFFVVGVSKHNGFPQIIRLFIGFGSLIFTIHFGGFSIPLFLVGNTHG